MLISKKTTGRSDIVLCLLEQKRYGTIMLLAEYTNNHQRPFNGFLNTSLNIVHVFVCDQIQIHSLAVSRANMLCCCDKNLALVYYCYRTMVRLMVFLRQN